MEEKSTRRIALVTGGSRGIGLAIARDLAAKGYQVAITGRNRSHLDTAQAGTPGILCAYAGDAAEPDDVKRIAQSVTAELGIPDVLVNNAGISGIGGSFLKADLDRWWSVQEVNLRGPMLFMRSLLPLMVERGSGTVFNIGSFAAVKPLPENSAYCVSKAALARLTDSVAQELSGTGVELFCLSPGLVETDMTRDVEAFKKLPPEVWSQPSDICRLIHQLLENDCSALSGRFIHVHDQLDRILKESGRILENGLYQIGMYNLDGRIV